MKPIARDSGTVFPLAMGLAALPFWIEAPFWGAVATAGAAIWAYLDWRRTLDRRAPLPKLEGETFAPLDASIAWRTLSGDFPAARRGWQATLTEGDLWLAPIRVSSIWGGDRDYVRVSRLDVVGCDLASDSEVRVRFLDEEGRVQEARLTHVPRAVDLAAALGYEGERGPTIADLGLLD